jgi:hypothetical protein
MPQPGLGIAPANIPPSDCGALSFEDAASSAPPLASPGALVPLEPPSPVAPSGPGDSPLLAPPPAITPLPTTALPEELPVLLPELEESPLEGLPEPAPEPPLPESVDSAQLAAMMHAPRRAARPMSAEIRILLSIYDEWQ